eukprot:150322-Chlamydomonas_euryale.AAC.1
MSPRHRCLTLHDMTSSHGIFARDPRRRREAFFLDVPPRCIMHACARSTDPSYRYKSYIGFTDTDIPSFAGVWAPPARVWALPSRLWAVSQGCGCPHTALSAALRRRQHPIAPHTAVGADLLRRQHVISPHTALSAALRRRQPPLTMVAAWKQWWWQQHPIFSGQPGVLPARDVAG